MLHAVAVVADHGQLAGHQLEPQIEQLLLAVFELRSIIDRTEPYLWKK